MVVTVAPLSATVPPALVVTDAAVTAALKVVVPVVLTVKPPNAPSLAPPTIPVKVTLPEPLAPTVSELPAKAALFTVDEKPTVPVEPGFKVTEDPAMVTAPL